jgi:hypothetical protein
MLSILIIPTPHKQNTYLTTTPIIISLMVSVILIATTYLALGCGGNNAPTEATFGSPRFWLADSPHDDAICKSFSDTKFSFDGNK